MKENYIKSAMFEALTDMSTAMEEYANSDCKTAMSDAIRSVRRSAEALLTFSNDYPYSESIFNECKALKSKLEDMEERALAGEYNQ